MIGASVTVMHVSDICELRDIPRQVENQVARSKPEKTPDEEQVQYDGSSIKV
jgi:hypothetical protein